MWCCAFTSSKFKVANTSGIISITQSCSDENDGSYTYLAAFFLYFAHLCTKGRVTLSSELWLLPKEHKLTLLLAQSPRHFSQRFVFFQFQALCL